MKRGRQMTTRGDPRVGSARTRVAEVARQAMMTVPAQGLRPELGDPNARVVDADVHEAWKPLSG